MPRSVGPSTHGPALYPGYTTASSRRRSLAMAAPPRPPPRRPPPAPPPPPPRPPPPPQQKHFPAARVDQAPRAQSPRQRRRPAEVLPQVDLERFQPEPLQLEELPAHPQAPLLG